MPAQAPRSSEQQLPPSLITLDTISSVLFAGCTRVPRVDTLEHIFYRFKRVDGCAVNGIYAFGGLDHLDVTMNTHLGTRERFNAMSRMAITAGIAFAGGGRKDGYIDTLSLTILWLSRLLGDR